MGKWTRRAFIGAGTVVGGGFVLGVTGLVLSPTRHSVVSDDALEKGELTTWITFTPDNIVTVLVPHYAMSGGTRGGCRYGPVIGVPLASTTSRARRSP